ncbi:MAG: hypothetical protein EPN85_11080, partial [Bacteroidetes bacterium]
SFQPLKVFSFLALTFLVFSKNTIAQTPVNVAINYTGASADAKALLDVSAADKGILIPRVALTASNSNAPIGSPLPAGLMVYNTSTSGASPNNVTPGYYYWEGAKWVALGGGSGGLDWSLLGNAGTTDGTSFIGTTDNLPLNIRVNNQKAGRVASTGEVFFGYQAGNSNTVASNTGIGYQALYSNSTGTNNTAAGYKALYTNSTGGGNTAIGREALRDNSDGTNNVAIGPYNLQKNTSGTSNIGIGNYLLTNNTTGSYNIALGVNALYTNTSGSQNVAIGSNAMQNNLSGTGNTAVGGGSQTLYANTTGYDNCAYGNQSMNSNTIGFQNTAIGSWSLKQNMDGDGNTALGYRAMYNNISGNNNVAIGTNAFDGSNTGSNNIGIGSSAMRGNNPSGWENIALGSSALYNISTGGSNVAIGAGAGSNNSTGSGNVFLGYQAGYNETGSNKLYISNSSTTAPLIGGDFSTGKVGIGTSAPGAKLQIDGSPAAEAFRVNTGVANGADLSIKYGGSNEIVSIGSWTNGGIQFYSTCCGYTNPADGSIKLYPRTGNATFKGAVTASCGVLACSDSRYKKNITELDGSLNKIKKINGYTYYWRTGEFPELSFNEQEQIGFIAQELELVFPQVVFTDEKGFKTVDYAKITPVLAEAIKDQQKIIEGQQTAIDKLQTTNDKQQTEILTLKSLLLTRQANHDARLKALEQILGTKAEK